MARQSVAVWVLVAIYLRVAYSRGDFVVYKFVKQDYWRFYYSRDQFRVQVRLSVFLLKVELRLKLVPYRRFSGHRRSIGGQSYFKKKGDESPH
ncbi:hypothetical protein ARMSODRAFT_961096 [Armillaria solidipes]|uniref:Uncharacterized protein n=1 Tax=Armillaria solidipes TaxID=1076256 RepID=A0A2H3B4G1_9AGAR|nr:hypothetical protein ARMSODRAFT_961096 [Armillaria solidipes]